MPAMMLAYPRLLLLDPLEKIAIRPGLKVEDLPQAHWLSDPKISRYYLRLMRAWKGCHGNLWAL